MLPEMQTDHDTAHATVHHRLFETAFGPSGLAWTAHGLVGVQLPGSSPDATEKRLVTKAHSTGEATPPPWAAALIADLKRYFAGEPIDFSAVPVDLSGVDPLRRKLYEAMRALPWGQTTTYGALAREIGLSEPEAARDVGQAMGRNPVPIVIPCHRVLAAGNKLGGFSAPGGSVTKAKLLALEGVHLDGGAPRLPGL
jgi:methylated-DNA-[protein]-cysteine S-methyltransferase